MECVRNNQLKANGKRENKKYEIKYPISLYVEKMIKQKKKQSESKGVKKKKKISPKTVTYYWRTVQIQVLPYFGNFDATTITQEQIQEHFDTLDYSPKYLKDIRLVLKLSLDLVIKEKLRADNPAEKVEIISDKKSLGIEIEHLEQDRQEIWLNIFEKDKRQWVYLFESILLTGARPEEACGFKWCSIDFEKDIVHINNAYKDTILYDENGQPFVYENLTNKMPQFIKKYNLEHLTTYGLRHSFATLCSTLGMPPEVLHVIMGHADFDTTRKYYIHITEEKKKNEMLKLYR